MQIRDLVSWNCWFEWTCPLRVDRMKAIDTLYRRIHTYSQFLGIELGPLQFPLHKNLSWKYYLDTWTHLTVTFNFSNCMFGENEATEIKWIAWVQFNQFRPYIKSMSSFSQSIIILWNNYTLTMRIYVLLVILKGIGNITELMVTTEK